MRETWRLTLADLVRHSGAALDFNAIHHDADAARAAGVRFRAPVYVRLPARVSVDSGQITVTCGEPTGQVEMDGQPDPSAFAELAGRPVADHLPRVERGTLSRLAAAPTVVFAPPSLGWCPDDQPDPAATRPDAVADSARRAPGGGGGLRFTDDHGEPVVTAVTTLLATEPSA